MDAALLSAASFPSEQERVILEKTGIESNHIL
jgi:hypothetical protein